MARSLILIVLLMLLITSCASPPVPTAAPLAPTATPAFDTSLPSLVLVNGTLIDGTGANPIEDAVLIIQGERIVAVGARSAINRLYRK